MHVFMCVHMYARVHLYKCMHACRSQRSASCVFLHYSSHIFLRQTLEPTNLARTADWQAPTDPLISARSAQPPELE